MLQRVDPVAQHAFAIASIAPFFGTQSRHTQSGMAWIPMLYWERLLDIRFTHQREILGVVQIHGHFGLPKSHHVAVLARGGMSRIA